MMPHFTFEIKPLIVRQQDAESDDLADHHFANRVEIATSFGKIGDASRVAFVFSVPNRVEVYAQPGFRSSVIHGPETIIDFLSKRAKRNLDRGSQAADAKGGGNDLEGGGKSSRKFSIDFQIDLRVAFGGPHGHLAC